MYACHGAASVKCVTPRTVALGLAPSAASAAQGLKCFTLAQLSHRERNNRLRSWSVPIRPLSGSQVQRKQRHRNQRLCTSATFKPYPYSADDYLQVRLGTMIYNQTDSDVPSATIVLNRVEDGDTHMDQGLMISIAGDSVFAISSLLLPPSDASPRPIALNLLWKVLERGQELSKREWLLKRVAIVSMNRKTYIGRLFFGDKETGEAVWDIDCRPSDGIWLSIKSKCPMFIHKQVWAEHKVPATFYLGEHESIESKHEVESWQNMAGTKAFTTIRSKDPEPVKRLKREMAVALAEEDYISAVRIRDHPFMKLSVQIVEKRIAGQQSEADSLQTKLEEAIKLSGSPSAE